MNRLLQACIILSLMMIAGCVSVPLDFPKEISVAITNIPSTRGSLKVQSG